MLTYNILLARLARLSESLERLPTLSPLGRFAIYDRSLLLSLILSFSII